MVKYVNSDKKKYGIKENAVYKGSNLLRDRERQGELLQTEQMADTPIKKR